MSTVDVIVEWVLDYWLLDIKHLKLSLGTPPDTAPEILKIKHGLEFFSQLITQLISTATDIYHD